MTTQRRRTLEDILLGKNRPTRTLEHLLLAKGTNQTNQRPDGKHRPIILFSPGQKTSATNRTKSLFSTEKSYQQRIYWLLSTMQKIYLHILHQTNTYWCIKLWCAWSSWGKESVKNFFGDLLTTKVLIIMLCGGSSCTQCFIRAAKLSQAGYSRTRGQDVRDGVVL